MDHKESLARKSHKPDIRSACERCGLQLLPQDHYIRCRGALSVAILEIDAENLWKIVETSRGFYSLIPFNASVAALRITSLGDFISAADSSNSRAEPGSVLPIERRASA